MKWDWSSGWGFFRLEGRDFACIQVACMAWHGHVRHMGASALERSRRGYQEEITLTLMAHAWQLGHGGGYRRIKVTPINPLPNRYSGDGGSPVPRLYRLLLASGWLRGAFRLSSTLPISSCLLRFFARYQSNLEVSQSTTVLWVLNVIFKRTLRRRNPHTELIKFYKKV